MNHLSASIPESLAIARRFHGAGQLQQAEQLYRQILQVDPKHASAMHLLGVIAYQTGAHPAGIELIEKSITIDPNDPTAYNNLGAVQQAVGDFSGAERSYRRAIEIRPSYVDSYSNLGAALLRQGKYDDAIAACRQALQLKPDFAAAYSNMGSALRAKGARRDALSAVQRAVDIAPNLADAWRQKADLHNELGESAAAKDAYQQLLKVRPNDASVLSAYGYFLVSRREFNNALEIFDRAISLSPENAMVHQGRAIALHGMTRNSEAIAAAQEAIRINPSFAPIHNNIAVIYRELHLYDEAIAACQRSLQIEPNNADAHNNLAGVYKELGEIPNALKHCHAAIRANSNHALAYKNLSSMKRFTVEDEDEIRWMKSRLTDDTLSNDAKVHMLFALGKIHDDIGKYDDAFEHYRQGNEMVNVVFQEAALQTWNRRFKEMYSRDLFDRLGGIGDPSDQPVFIVGMPRSGSTLLEQILASHQDIFGAGELRSINELTQHVSVQLGQNIDYPGCIEHLTGEVAQEAAGRYLAELRQYSRDSARVTDKMPTNFSHLGFIALLFPNARIIHCRRNPLDVCVSCYFEDFSWRIPYAYDLANLGKFYRMYEDVMAHWREVLPIEIHEVVYRDVVERPEETIRGMVDYLGLPWDPNCLEFHKTERTVRTASVIQVRQPIHSRSLDRWKNYERHLGPLRAALGE